MNDPNLLRLCGAGKAFWPQVYRLDKGQHPLHPEHICLILTIPAAPSSPADQQALIDELYVASKEGAPMATDSSKLTGCHWIVPEPGDLVLARPEGADSNGTQDTVVGLALTPTIMNSIFPEAEKILQVG